MSNAYNIRNRLAQSAHVGRNVRKAPASGGVVKVDPVDLAVVVFDSTGARTLESAAGMGLGQRIVCIASVSGVSVNSVAIADGAFAEFVVVQNTSGVQEWQVASSTAAVASNAVIVAAQAAPTDITGDLVAYSNATVQLIIDALVAAGLATDSTTDTT